MCSDLVSVEAKGVNKLIENPVRYRNHRRFLIHDCLTPASNRLRQWLRVVQIDRGASLVRVKRIYISLISGSRMSANQITAASFGDFS